MYDFLFQEGFWMKEIISAIINMIGVVVAAWLACHYAVKKGLDNIVEIKEIQKEEKEKQGKEGIVQAVEREKERSEHSNLSKEHNQILDQLEESKKISLSVKEAVLETKHKDEERYGSLTDKQKDIVNSVNHLQQIAGEIKYLQESNTKLIAENQILISKNKELVSENQTLRSRVDDIAKRMYKRNQNQEISDDMEHEME